MVKCSACGTRRDKIDMAVIYQGRERPRYVCHPGDSEGPTCYSTPDTTEADLIDVLALGVSWPVAKEALASIRMDREGRDQTYTLD